MTVCSLAAMMVKIFLTAFAKLRKSGGLTWRNGDAKFFPKFAQAPKNIA